MLRFLRHLVRSLQGWLWRRRLNRQIRAFRRDIADAKRGLEELLAAEAGRQ